MDDLNESERLVMKDAANRLAVVTLALASRRDIDIKRALAILAPMVLDAWTEALVDRVKTAIRTIVLPTNG